MLISLSDQDECRARTLHALRSPDESRDAVLRQFVLLASQALGIPGSFISVLDDEHQYIKAAHNFYLSQSTRHESLCRYAVDSDSAVVIPDTWLDERFAKHPLIVGAPYIRFYAGVPLKNSAGMVLGTLCVTDTAPHSFRDDQVATLNMLAALVTSFLDAWFSADFTDPVTNLPNRQRLIRDLQFIALSGDTSPRRLVLIDCIDMPRAWELARAMGMGQVESLLKDVATLLPLRLRPAPGEILYTVATGRFALLTRQESRLSAEWVAGQLAGISVDLGEGLTAALMTHAGEARFITGTIPAQMILHRAANALHEAIARDVASLCFNEGADTRQAQDGLLMHELAVAIRQDKGLWLAYQPKICLHSGQPVGLEALIRWQHPQHGELSPAQFLPLAEQTALPAELTTWVMDQAIIRLSRLRNSYIQLPVTITVGYSDFSRAGFADELEGKMAKAKLPVSLLGIECSETERMLENPAAMRCLERLKLHGFAISLDDVDSGYRHISSLQHLSPDSIKLDGLLIREISGDTASRLIIRRIIAMLKDQDYRVFAAGGEPVESVALLNGSASSLSQGYFYSKPLREAALDEWLGWRLRGQC